MDAPTAQPHPVTNEPMAVHSRGRLYLSRRQREQLNCEEDERGSGTDLTVKVDVVDRDPDWGIQITTAVFRASIVTDGAVRIPKDARRRLGIDRGQTVRVSIQRGRHF